MDDYSAAQLRQLQEEQEELLKLMRSGGVRNPNIAKLHETEKVLATIGRFLTPKTMTSALRVCKRWSQLLLSDDVWQPRFADDFGVSAGTQPFDHQSWREFYRNMKDGRRAWVTSPSVAVLMPQDSPHKHQSVVRALDVRGKLVATAGADFVICLWELPRMVSTKKLRGHTSGVTSVLLEEKRIFSGGSDGSLKLWNLRSGQSLKTVYVHSMPVTGICSLDELTFATSSMDGSIKTHHKESLDLIHVMGLSLGHILCIAVCPGFLVSGGSDSNVRLWNPVTGAQVMQMLGHAGQVTCVITSPAGKEIVTGGVDRTVRLWDQLGQCKRIIDADSPVESLCWGSSGAFLFFSTRVGSVCMIEKATFTHVRPTAFFAGKAAVSLRATCYEPGQYALVACCPGDKLPMVRAQLYDASAVVALSITNVLDAHGKLAALQAKVAGGRGAGKAVGKDRYLGVAAAAGGGADGSPKKSPSRSDLASDDGSPQPRRDGSERSLAAGEAQPQEEAIPRTTLPSADAGGQITKEKSELWKRVKTLTKSKSIGQIANRKEEAAPGSPPAPAPKLVVQVDGEPSSSTNSNSGGGLLGSRKRGSNVNLSNLEVSNSDEDSGAGLRSASMAVLAVQGGGGKKQGIGKTVSMLDVPSEIDSGGGLTRSRSREVDLGIGADEAEALVAMRRKTRGISTVLDRDHVSRVEALPGEEESDSQPKLSTSAGASKPQRENSLSGAGAMRNTSDSNPNLAASGGGGGSGLLSRRDRDRSSINLINKSASGNMRLPATMPPLLVLPVDGMRVANPRKLLNDLSRQEKLIKGGSKKPDKKTPKAALPPVVYSPLRPKEEIEAMIDDLKDLLKPEPIEPPKKKKPLIVYDVLPKDEEE
jgi:hypothetical protein